MHKHLLFALLICIIPYCVPGQSLTREEMAGDFDQLTQIINDFYSAKNLAEQRTHSDIPKELMQIKEQCNFISTDAEFAGLVRKALNTLCDKHAALANSEMVKMYLSRFPDLAAFAKIAPSDTLKADYYYDLACNRMLSNMKTGIRVRYIDGNYYVSRPFISNGITVKSAEKITAINHIPVSQYVAQHNYELFSLGWDEKKAEWYSELFWINRDILQADTFCLSIGQKEVQLKCSETVKGVKKQEEFTNSPLVSGIGSNILYIRIPYMFDAEWYAEQIMKQFQPNMNKIIIDIRGNRGGQDGVWQKIVSILASEPLIFKTHISMNDNPASRSVLPLYHLTEPVLLSSDTIFPDPGHIPFKGKIYILQDQETYSAASSLSSLAFQTDQWVLIGQPTSGIGGRGLTPLLFKLEHSGITFRLPFTVDLSGGELNPYMNRVEVEIPEGVDEYFEKQSVNPYDIAYLISNDKYIEFVKNQK